MSEKVKLTQEEIDLLTELIKEGKTLRQIAEEIYPHKISKQAPTISRVELKQIPTVEVKIDYLVDNKRISLGAGGPIREGLTLQEAHEQLYSELLNSMENIVSLSKDTTK